MAGRSAESRSEPARHAQRCGKVTAPAGLWFLARRHRRTPDAATVSAPAEVPAA
jgi:hypothetical protein